VIGRPTTWIYTDEFSRESVLEGIKRGHVFVSKDISGPGLYLNASCDDKEVMMGDVLQVSRKESALFRVNVKGGEGKILRIISKDGTLKKINIKSANFFAEETISFVRDNYVRAEIWNKVRWPWARVALTNPIYIEIKRR
jgi:hypothetical protein